MPLPDDLLQLQTRVLEDIAVGEDVTTCLEHLCRLAEDMVEGSICSVMLLDDRGTLQVAAAPKAGPELIAELNGLVPGDLAGSCGTSVHQKQPVYVEDTRTDPRWGSMRSLAAKHGFEACWSVPIFSATQNVLGTFAISNAACHAPSGWNKQLLRTASHLAGIAVARHRQDEEVHEARRRYQDLFENSPDMIATVDAATGTLIDCNETLVRQLGIARDELIGQPVTTVYEPASSDQAARIIDALANRDQASSEDLQLQCHDGGTIEVSLKATPVHDDREQVVRYRAVWRDITKRKRAEEAMRQSQKLESLGLLASGIAHDFNNLLVGIMGNADLALDCTDADSEAHEAVEAITEASQRAADLTRQLLAYAGRGRLAMTGIDLNDLVREMIGLVSSSIAVPVHQHLAPHGAATTGDATQIRQVLMNLLTNAGDASINPGSIDVRTGVEHLEADDFADCVTGRDLPAGDYAFVEVRDHGCGMDAATIERIFDPFFTTKNSGRGLGLAATLGIVTSHRGALAVESTPGEGTTFRLLCPATAQQSRSLAGNGSTQGNTADHEPGSGAANHTTVLIVDDEPAVLNVLARMMRSAEHEVLTASCGEEAVVIAAEHQQDLDAVVLDVTMPGMSGQETFASLRALREDLPVVFCSGQSAEGCAHLCENDDYATFVSKPFGGAKLRGALDELWRHRATTNT